ncbi:hypothetical protein [Solirhodobacter olei]|uniref:hypothetical protein n=1 Tax=Solirhodobacter olei TaxID=2493082 RepID=UPI000FDAB4E2|nr:hypothetical protein [Solirhodobacter olei]
MGKCELLKVATIAVTLAGTTTAGRADTKNPFADAVRAANARFQDVAVAVKEGYSPIPCDSAPAGGGMGIHYVSGMHLKDKALDIAHPQAVMYEPQPDGSLKLIAVEYITFKGPASIGGHLMNFNGAPNSYGLKPFYEIHVWAWKTNRRGTFADDNPDVSCDHMPMPAK